MTIRIVLADDHPVVRRGLSQFLAEESGLDVVRECEDGESALAAIQETKPDIAILDLRMPGLDGLAVLRRVVENKLNVRVIILAGSITDNEVIEAMRLGVKGIALKEMAPALLVQSIRKVAAGGTWLEKDAVSRVMDRLLQSEEWHEQLNQTLTRREVEIVRMVVSGLNNRDIGEKLFISEGTVKSHLHAIFEKVGVKSRTQLMIYAREQKIG